MPERTTTKSQSSKKASQSKPSKKKKTTTRSRKAPPPPPSFLQRLKAFLSEPGAFRKINEHLPSWSDEVGAFTLIIMGLLTVTALFNPTGDIMAPLANALKQAFGMGAYLVALAVMGIGALMLLAKAGFQVTWNWVRFLAVELVFISLLGIFHLTAFDSNPRQLASNGEGGGYVGWAVSTLVSDILGNWLAIIILGVVLVISTAITLGIRRRDVRMALITFSDWLQETIANLQTSTPTEDIEPIIEETPQSNNPATSVAEEEPLPTSVPKAESARAPASKRRPKSVSSSPKVPTDDEAAPPTRASKRSTRRKSSRRSAPEVPSHPEPVVANEASSKNNGAAKSTEEDVDIPTAVDDTEPAVPDMEEVVSGELEPVFNTVVINGQVVQTSVDVTGRPSVVPREDDANNETTTSSQRASTSTTTVPKRRQQTRRHFVVEGFHDKRKVGRRSKKLPPLDALQYIDLQLPSEEEVNLNARIIEETMLEFDIDADVIDVRVGPAVTQYAVSPIKEVFDENGERTIIRTRVSKIAALSSDLALALSSKTLRIEAPVPGHSYVGVEVPNREPSIVALRSLLETDVFYEERKKPLAFPLGRDVSGDPIVVNLAVMPHLLVAGTTGSGKSVFLRSLITSLVMNNTPDRVRMIVLDPKMVEFVQFSGLPHLIGPVETDTERIIGVLRWAAREMDRRYKLLELEKARNIESYNELLGRRRKRDHLPYIVVIVDEIGDLMMMRPDETEKTLTRLAQKARAAGMHLVVATQRPSVDVITGLIKANFPARISFAVAAGVDSRVILDSVGAETLVGKGDMLFLGPDAAGPKRVQGCFVDDDEINNAVGFWREWHERMIEEGKMDKPGVPPWEQAMTRLESLSQLDPVLEEALKLVVLEGKASVSLIQRRLGIGYPRAARLMDSLYELGIIGSPKAGGKSREVLVKTVAAAHRMIQNNRRKELL